MNNISDNILDNNIKMSVIVPIYNAEEFLRKSIPSILNQTLSSIEFIFVDDGSTDNSLALLKELTKDVDSVTILTQKNQYAGIARNNGLKHAKGEYVYFFDCDDEMCDEFVLEKLYDIAKTNDLDVLRGKTFTVDYKTNEIIKNNHYAMMFCPKECFNKVITDISKNLFLAILPGTPWCGISRRKFLIENEIWAPDLICINDLSFYIETLVKAKKIMVCDIYILNYKVNNSSSLVGNLYRNFEDVLKVYHLIKDIVKNSDKSFEFFILNARLKFVNSWLIRFEQSEYFEKNLDSSYDFFINLDYSIFGGKENCVPYLEFFAYYFKNKKYTNSNELKELEKSEELKELKELFKDIKTKMATHDKIYIFGAGIVGERTYNRLKDENIKILGFIDNNEEKQKSGYLGLPVKSMQDFDKNIPVVLAVSVKFFFEAKEDFEKNGYIWLENLFTTDLYYYLLYDFENGNKLED